MLWAKYDALILDLDGVVYIGEKAVPFAIESLNSVSELLKISAATNNASRTSSQVATHLRELGLNISDLDVVTSAQAGSKLISSLIPAGSQVLVVGGTGVEMAVKEVGLHPIRATKNHESNDIISREVEGVIQGHGVDTSWWDLNTAALAIANAKPWVATNRDSTVPTPYGLGPGNGTFVQLLENLTGVTPLVAGKPEPTLFEETVNRLGVKNALVIGDRIDTDIEGANRCGLDSLLVLTGVHKVADIRDDDLGKPTYVAQDLRCLLSDEPPNEA
jgi:HAD superfamily hydrolase (TIGR01450 family)